MDIDGDRYNPNGHLELRVEHFSRFAKSKNAEAGQRSSQPVFIRGLPWMILAIPRKSLTETGNAMGFFLVCNADAQSTTWSCKARAVLAIKSQREGVDDNVRQINHRFYAKENDWGFSQYSTCSALLNSANGFINDDTVVLTVDVEADEPQGILDDALIVDKIAVVVNPLKQMLIEGLNSDVQLVCDDETIPAHRGILSAHSPVFRSMFAREEMLESREGIVRIEDATAEMIRLMLNFIYSGELSISSLKRNYNGLLVLAEKYDFRVLKEHVEHFIASRLSVKNVLRATELADAHNAPILKKSCFALIAVHAKSIAQSGEWQELKKRNGPLIIEILEATIVSDPTSS